MNNSPSLIKKIILLSIIATAICLFFWLGSRYPALNLKALMSAQTAFAGIGFDILIPVTGQQSFFIKVLNNTVNWLYSNMTGMSFGLLISPYYRTYSLKTPSLPAYSALLLVHP